MEGKSDTRTEIDPVTTCTSARASYWPEKHLWWPVSKGLSDNLGKPSHHIYYNPEWWFELGSEQDCCLWRLQSYCYNHSATTAGSAGNNLWCYKASCFLLFIWRHNCKEAYTIYWPSPKTFVSGCANTQDNSYYLNFLSLKFFVP